MVETVKNFLGNRKAVKYKDTVAKLLRSLQNMGANMSNKFHSYTAILIASPQILMM